MMIHFFFLMMVFGCKIEFVAANMRSNCSIFPAWTGMNEAERRTVYRAFINELVNYAG